MGGRVNKDLEHDIILRSYSGNRESPEPGIIRIGSRFSYFTSLVFFIHGWRKKRINNDFIGRKVNRASAFAGLPEGSCIICVAVKALRLVKKGCFLVFIPPAG